MQYAVGAPLPPHGQASGAGAAMHWTPNPGPTPPAPSGPPPAPAAPPAQQPAAQQGWHGPAPQQAPAGGHSTTDITGHIQLPPGAPVALPSPPADTAAPDASQAAVAVLLIGPAG
ncbi:Pro-rich N-terminal domain-containing protein, partial [Streptomyces lydicus]|uniref:Pro-rich N-terminal domain-containing protein n=2 Tax=Streptomyces TaxID=1883 RepID=UPI00331FA908